MLCTLTWKEVALTAMEIISKYIHTEPQKAHSELALALAQQ